MPRPLPTAGRLFLCSGQFREGTGLGLSIIQRVEVLQSAASLLVDHALEVRGRDHYPAAVMGKLSGRGCNSPNSLVTLLGKNSKAGFMACGIHRKILLSGHQCHFSTKVHYRKSIISIAAFAFHLIDQKLVPIEA